MNKFLASINLVGLVLNLAASIHYGVNEDIKYFITYTGLSVLWCNALFGSLELWIKDIKRKKPLL